MPTFRDLFSQAYLTPQEISTETCIPLATVYAPRDGRPVEERYMVRALRMVNSRLSTSIQLQDLDAPRLLER